VVVNVVASCWEVVVERWNYDRARIRSFSSQAELLSWHHVRGTAPQKCWGTSSLQYRVKMNRIRENK